MGKVVVLRLDGNFEKGFQVTLEIGEDGKPRWSPATGKLPPIPEISQLYESWQYAFRGLGSRFRLEWEEEEEADDAVVRFSPGVNSSCKNFNEQLKESINDWLDSEDFRRRIKKELWRELNSSDEVRVIIQTDEKRLWQLPWGVWDFFDDFPNAGVALSTIEHIPVKYSVSEAPTDKIRILAILGNHTGINVEADRKELNKLVDADIEFLDEPERSDFEALWDKSWDILYFAGHSKTEGEEGIINFNKNESLRLGELKDTLRRAIQKGLKLAIFNSCQGLGLAYEFASLHIPQAIVMREPVPDRVAQEFLKYFLKAFSSGRLLYASVRDAQAKLRELQRLEERFPGASWLPVICQNLAEVPPTWQQLRGIEPELEIDNVSRGEEKTPLAKALEFLPSGFELLDQKFFDTQGKRGESRILKLREATWSLIIQGNYIERDQQDELLAMAEELAEFGGISLLLIRGEPGAGKTAMMRWLVYELFQQGHLVLQKKTQDEDLKWLEPLRKFSEQMGEQHFYVFADDLFREELILDELKQNQLQFPFTLIGTTRLNEDQHESLDGLGYAIKVLNVNPPSEGEKERILDKVCEDPAVQARLEDMEAADRKRLMAAPAMLVLMLQLSEGKTFAQTVADIIKKLPSTEQRPAYHVFGVICSFFRYGIAVPPEVVFLCLQPQFSLEAVQDVVDCAETAELAGLVNIVSKDGAEGLVTIHELIAKTAIELDYKPRNRDNPPYSHRSLERYLVKAIQALDASQEAQRRWAYHGLNQLAVIGETDLVRQVLNDYPNQIQALQEGCDVTGWSIWSTIYQALGLFVERDRCIAATLSIEPQNWRECIYLLSLIGQYGRPQQKREAIDKTTIWLQQHPEDYYVRTRYLALIEKYGTTEQRQEVIDQTANWLQGHPEDYHVRTQYLKLIEKCGTSQQKQQAITQTVRWLEHYQKDYHVRTKYLALIKSRGTFEQKQEAITLTSTWLQDHPEDTSVRIQYLNLIEQCGTSQQKQQKQQKQQAIAQTVSWLDHYQDDYDVRTKYLVLVKNRGTSEQKQEAIAQTATWLQHHPEDSYVRTKYLALIGQCGTSEQKQEAIAQTATWLQHHPEDMSVRSQYLAVTGQCGTAEQRQEALSETSVWLQQHPENTSVRTQYIELLKICGTLQQKQEALSQTSVWLQQHPENTGVRTQYIELLRIFGTSQQKQEALIQTAIWLQQHPGNTSVRTQYPALIRECEDYIIQDAVNSALENYPEDQVIICLMFGYFRDYLGYELCYQLADLIAKLFSQERLPIDQWRHAIHAANFFRDYGALDTAEAIYQEVLKTADFWANKQLANIQQLKKPIQLTSLNYARLLVLRNPPEPYKALDSLEAILAEKPRHAVAHWYMAQCYQALGKKFYPQAITSFQKAVEFDRGINGQKTGHFWYEFGCFYRDAMGNRTEACNCFENSLNQKINLPACVDLAELEVQDGNLECARELLQQGLALIPITRPEKEQREKLEPRIQAIQAQLAS